MLTIPFTRRFRNTRTRLRIAALPGLLLSLAFLAGCEEYPLIVGGVGGRPGADGAADAMAGSGGAGGAESGGSGGMTASDAGRPPFDGPIPEGCAMANEIFMRRCIACHSTSAAKDFGGFDVEKPGWAAALIGNGPAADAPVANKCKGKGLVYLEVGTQPARGLFLDKFTPTPPCGVQMPQLPPKFEMGSAEIACLQNWANNIVAGGNGF